VVGQDEEVLQCLFANHVVPIIGQQSPREITLTSLQLLVNKMADDGYRKSAVGKIRTYLRTCFEYAANEDLIQVRVPKVQLNVKSLRCSRLPAA
jgi:hypothetical protein